MDSSVFLTRFSDQTETFLTISHQLWGVYRIRWWWFWHSEQGAEEKCTDESALRLSLGRYRNMSKQTPFDSRMNSITSLTSSSLRKLTAETVWTSRNGSHLLHYFSIYRFHMFLPTNYPGTTLWLQMRTKIPLKLFHEHSLSVVPVKSSRDMPRSSWDWNEPSMPSICPKPSCGFEVSLRTEI